MVVLDNAPVALRGGCCRDLESGLGRGTRVPLREVSSLQQGMGMTGIFMKRFGMKTPLISESQIRY